MNEEKKIEEYSQEKGNAELLPLDISDSKKIVEPFSGSQNNISHNIVVGTMNFFAEPFRNRHKKHYRDSWFHLIADIVLVAIIVFLIGAWYWAAHLQIGEDVVFSIHDGDGTAVSGQVQSFRINFQNNSHKKLEDCRVSLVLPENFVLKRVLPENIFDATTNTFRVGDLESGANGEVRIEGVPLGERSGHQSISSVLNFSTAGHRDRKMASLLYIIDGSVLDLTLSAPDQVYVGADFEVGAVLQNNSENDLHNIVLQYGDNKDFSVKNVECDKKCESRDNNISFDKIVAGGKVEIIFKVIPLIENGKTNFSMSAFIAQGKEKFKQDEEKREIELRLAGFRAELISPVEAVQLGKERRYKIKYQNNEEAEIKNLVINYKSGNSNFVVGDVKMNGMKSEGALKMMGPIKSGQEGEINLDVTWIRNSPQEEQEVFLLLDISYSVDGKNALSKIRSNPVKVLSDLKVGSRGLYYSSYGDQLGIGPVPPIVEIPTTYWVYWDLENAGNNLSAFVMRAKIPTGVSLTGEKSVLAGDLAYHEESSDILWTVNRIDKAKGEYRASFGIRVVPSTNDVGKVLSLLQNVSFSVQDDFCGEQVAGQLKNIDTNLLDDVTMKGKGKVEAGF